MTTCSYCSNIKHHYLCCLCVSSYTSPILPHCYVLHGQFPHYSRAGTSSPWVASSLVWSSAVPGAALISSTVWRRLYCLENTDSDHPSLHLNQCAHHRTARQGGKPEVMQMSCDRHGTVQSLLVLIKPVRYNNASSIIAIGKAHSRYDNRFS